MSEQHDTYARLIALLDERGAVYRIIEHKEQVKGLLGGTCRSPSTSSSN
ncbi:hypothetical protein [Streptomyces lunaelactis]|nr:hypothetical protein [Streptomyces lunaelactis]